MTTQDLAGRLSQVHADSELTAHTFKVAFVLTQKANGAGVVPSAAMAKIGDVGEPVADVLGHLVARGHLEPVSESQRIKGFRLVSVVKHTMRSKTDGPPDYITYFEKPIGRLYARLEQDIAKLEAALKAAGQ